MTRLPMLLLLTACATSGSTSLQSAQLAAADDSLRALVDAFADSTRARALSIAIASGNRVVFAYARGSGASIHTLYRIGSVSKLLTATAAMRLVAQHCLDLDAEIHQYVPEFPAKPYPITARQLAGHLSGIRHYSRNEFINRTHYDSVAPTIAIFSRDSLLFPPGTRYGYSSYGYNLLSLAVERAAHHAGSSVGGRAILVVWPEDQLIIAIAGNLFFDASERTTFRFADLARAQQR